MSKVLVIAAICVTAVVAYFTTAKPRTIVVDLYDDSDDLDVGHWLRKAEPVSGLGMIDVPRPAATVKIEKTFEEREALQNASQYWRDHVNYYSTQSTQSAFVAHIHGELVQLCDDIRLFIGDEHFNYEKTETIASIWFPLSSHMATIGIIIENLKRDKFYDFEGELFDHTELLSLQGLMQDFIAIGDRIPENVLGEPPPPTDMLQSELDDLSDDMDAVYEIKHEQFDDE